MPAISNPPSEIAESISAYTFRLRHVPGGSFRMGSEDPEDSYWGKSTPVHTVTLPGFYMAEYPVTQALWQAVMGDNPSFFKGANRPVEQVSWDDAQAFIAALNAHPDKKTPGAYRLPTEAEWEYAARYVPAGVLPVKYAGSNLLSEVGWYGENSHDENKPVGLKAPNALGLYDLSGNVWEWCEDEWHSDYKGAPEDGSAWVDTGDRARLRVLRGGSWIDAAQGCRAAHRDDGWRGSRDDIVGFRLVLSFQSAGQPKPASL